MKYTLLLALLLLGCTQAAEPAKPCASWVTPHLEACGGDPQAAAMKWYDEARLGMFIHWGVWGPRHAAWTMYNRNTPLAEYQELARKFKGEAFDAQAIVALARKSGMNYITFVAKHHDGFCLWDSKATEFDSMDYPAHRDFLKELAAACAEAKMPLFIYYSFGIDWTHPDYLPRRLYVNARPNSADGRAMDAAWTPEHFERYRQFCLAQLTELCSNYGPIAGFWFDPLGGVLANSELFKTEEIYAHIRRLQPQALILNKTGITGSEDVVVGERELSSISHHYPGKSPEIQRIRALADAAWEKNRLKKAEIAVTSQGTWEWAPTSPCVPAATMFGMLQGAARHNANLLLNFGPRPDGSIPEDVAREFAALGALIDKDGYPPLNREGWRQLRGSGEALDKNEAVKTAR